MMHVVLIKAYAQARNLLAYPASSPGLIGVGRKHGQPLDRQVPCADEQRKEVER